MQKVYVTPYAFARFKEMERSNIVLYSGEAVALVGVLHLLVVFCEIVVFSVSVAADGSRNYQLWSPDVREACQLRSEIRLVWASCAHFHVGQKSRIFWCADLQG